MWRNVGDMMEKKRCESVPRVDAQFKDARWHDVLYVFVRSGGQSILSNLSVFKPGR